MRYSKGWAILSEACRRRTRRGMSEARIRGTKHIGEEVTVTLAFGVGREVSHSLWGMAALVLEVVELMAKLTYRIGPITGLVEKIWGLANSKSGVRGGKYICTQALSKV